MAPRVSVPIHLVVDAASLDDGEEIEAALSSATTKALDAAAPVMRSAAAACSLQFQGPDITWTGAGLGDVPTSVRLATDTRIRGVIRRVADASDVQGNAAPTVQPKKVADAPRDPFQQPPLGLLGSPPPPTLPMDEATFNAIEKMLLDTDGLTRSKGFLKLLPYLEKGDEAALSLVLRLAVRPDGAQPSEAAIASLKNFAKRYEDTFDRLLIEALTITNVNVPLTLTRTESNINVPKIYFAPLSLAGNIVAVTQAVPRANWLWRLWQKTLPGAQRFIAYVDELIAARRELEASLRSRPSEQSIAPLLAQRTDSLERLSGVVARVATDRSQSLGDLNVYDLEVDVLANIRWIVEVDERLREIALTIDAYREVYGPAADSTDEVSVLRQSRAMYLAALFNNDFPTAAHVEEIRAKTNLYLDNWQTLAAAIKLGKIDTGLPQLQEMLDNVQLPPEHNDSYAFRERLSKTASSLYEYRRQHWDAEDKVKAGSPTALPALVKLERELAVASVHIAMLILWWQALALSEAMDYPDHTGSSGERGRWRKKLDDIRAQIEAQYDSPDYGKLQQNFENWQFDLKSVGSDISRSRKEDLLILLGIGLLAIIVTAGAGLALGALEAPWVIVVLGEATTFTAVSTGLQAALLDKPIDPEDVAITFVENVALFGAFNRIARIANLGIEAVGAGRTLAKLGIVGGEAIAQAAVPPVLERLETGEWPEDTKQMLGAGLALNLIVGLLLHRRVLVESREQTAILKELDALAKTRAEWLTEMDDIAARGAVTKEEFAQAQKRGQKLYNEISAVLDRLSQMSEGGLRAMKLQAEDVVFMRQTAREWAQQIANAKYTPAPGVRALPAPRDVIPTGLVRRSPLVFEYNPNVAGRRAADVSALLRRAGYEVTDTGGGVLIAKPPARLGAGPTYRLLPAAPDVAPPSIRPATRLERRGVALIAQEPKLVAQITGMTNQDATGLVRAIGSLAQRGAIGPADTNALQGVLHFLEIGGEPATLIRLLSPRPLANYAIKRAMELLSELSPQGAQGVSTFMRLRPRLPAGQVAHVFINFQNEPKILNGIFEALVTLEPRSDGLGRILHFLYGDNLSNYKAAQGVLFSAIEELELHPGTRAVFEEPIFDPSGKVIRITDFRIETPGARYPSRRWRPGSTVDPFGDIDPFDVGRPLTPPSLKVEVKEVRDVSALGTSKVRGQFAQDILDDFRIRSQIPVPAGTSRPFFETVLWRIRYEEIAEKILAKLKKQGVINLTGIDDALVREYAEIEVKVRLRPALDRPELKMLPPDELVGYRRAFEEAKFVKFF